jgi:hypothetical protein
LNNGREKRLREKLNANDFVDEFEFGDDIEADVGVFVFEHGEEHGEKVVDGSEFVSYA